MCFTRSSASTTGSADVDRDDFRAFVARSFSRHPGIQALEWIPRVSHDERDAYVRAARRDAEDARDTTVRDALAAFEITDQRSPGVMTRGERRDEYFPVYYIEPMVGNTPALGFNLASNPTRLAALNAAPR